MSPAYPVGLVKVVNDRACRVSFTGERPLGDRIADRQTTDGVILMGNVAGRRMTAEIDGDFVVFLIGARFNDKLQFARALLDLGGRRGMKHMLDYLVAHPEKGLLAYELGIPTIVQYWRSFEQLEAFAKDRDDPHLDVWRQYWRRVGRSGRTGIWHETYLIKAGQYEAVYGNMPAHGLGKAGRLVPVSESSTARGRLGRVTA
jgi:hypothetical protein